MQQYLDLIKDILKYGEIKKNRTGIDTMSIFGTQTRYDLRQGFPLLTTKKMFFRGIVCELIWFIQGNTNIKYLVDRNVNIWNEWAYARYQANTNFQGETIETYIQKIKTDELFAQKYGDLGPIYGQEWRNFNGFDQLKWLINEIKTNPNSRRLIINAWNPPLLAQMALPPCHLLFQFNLSNNNQVLNLQLYQRSGDVFLGVPFNIASYCLLLHLIAKECNLEVGTFIHTIGDAHIYLNHLEVINTQLTRDPLPLSQISIQNFTSIFEIKPEDIQLTNYQSHGMLRAKVAV